MKKLFAVLFLGAFMMVVAQTTLSGVIRNEDGVVPSASITVEEAGNSAIIAYGISNTKGAFKLTFTSSAETLTVRIKAYNHKTLTKTIKNTTQTHNFTIETSATEIKEVKLKTKLITKRGDTLTYDLKSFASKADRTIADVLKKLPGIEVNKDGTVLYQGEAINEFLVNGKNLMEGGYGTVNNALPQDAVQKVEVMENHQPIKMLKDKVPSDKAAINIVLKKKITMTGRGEVGSGIAEPWLWNVKLTPMFFGQKNQWVINYKTNNIGESVEKESNLLSFGTRWEGIRGNVDQNTWLNVENASMPSLPEKRYLMNNVHFLSANILTNPFKNKDWELKANAHYVNNVIERESYSQNKDLQANQIYFTDVLNHFYTNKLKGELIFTKNAKKGFFKNSTTFTQFWNIDRARTNMNDAIYGLRNANESLESPTVNFRNSLSTIIPWKEKMVNLRSYINYQTDRQHLYITPASYAKVPMGYDASGKVNLFDFGKDTDKIVQNFRMKTFEANQSANVSFTEKHWTFTPEVGLDYQINGMISELNGLVGNTIKTYGIDYANDLNYTNVKPYVSLGVNYSTDNWRLYSNFPIEFNSTRVEDLLRREQKSLNKTTFSPSLYMQYSFASFWKASARGNIGYRFGDIHDVFAGNILTNPSQFSAMSWSNPIAQEKVKSSGIRIEYRNPLNNLFFNTGFNLSWNTRNLTPRVLTEGLATSRIEYIERDYNTRSQYVSAEIGKYFPAIKTNISSGYSYQLRFSEQMRNDDIWETKGVFQGITFKINNTYFEWLSLDYNARYNRNQRTLAGNTYAPSFGYNHNFVAYLYPFRDHTISFNWDQINSGNEQKKFSNAFFDLAYQYTWSARKIDFELKWINIANRKVFEDYSLSTLVEGYSRIQLRPSQVMLSVKFNFK